MKQLSSIFTIEIVKLIYSTTKSALNNETHTPTLARAYQCGWKCNDILLGLWLTAFIINCVLVLVLFLLWLCVVMWIDVLTHGGIVRCKQFFTKSITVLWSIDFVLNIALRIDYSLSLPRHLHFVDFRAHHNLYPSKIHLCMYNVFKWKSCTKFHN